MVDPTRSDPKELARRVLKAAGAARVDPARFFSFVIKEETSRAPVVTLPFQRVVLKFVKHYPKCVIRMPVGFSKTYLMAALSMYLLGHDPTVRGAIISASQGQAQKPLAMVRDYIESSPELRLVFPNLLRSPRNSDPWTQSKITVDRPKGIRDPSLSAIGVHGKLPGARLNWLLIDDILSEENTNTPEQRESVNKWFLSTVLSRRDIKRTRCVVTNTPWHPEDLTYTLEKNGWPTLTIDINGNIYFSNADDFDCDDIRPSIVDDASHRLTAHDSPLYHPELQHLEPAARLAMFPEGWQDLEDRVPLWPEKYGTAEIEQLKADYAAALHEYYQLYECRVRSDEDARCKVEWINNCKRLAREQGIFSFTSSWEGRSYTGVDIGVGRKRKHDKTSIFTFAILPDGMRRLLKLESGRWQGSTIIDKIIEHQNAYNSIIGVENNAAQDFIRQWALERDKSLRVRAHHTGMNKHSKAHGVESIFIELENGAWLIPNDPMGRVDPAVQAWIDAMLYHNPDQHTGDELMACWIARLQAGKKLRNRRRARDQGATPFGVPSPSMR